MPAGLQVFDENGNLEFDSNEVGISTFTLMGSFSTGTNNGSFTIPDTKQTNDAWDFFEVSEGGVSGSPHVWISGNVIHWEFGVIFSTLHFFDLPKVSSRIFYGVR